MKLTRYVTSPNVNFREFDCRPIPNLMGGATTVEIGNTPVMKGFMGFGVALTASSCYELNTMSAEARKAFWRTSTPKRAESVRGTVDSGLQRLFARIILV